MARYLKIVLEEEHAKALRDYPQPKKTKDGN
jgi:hypothetical protein